MTLESKQPLDTAVVQEAYPHEALPPHDRFGSGERYTFGTTHADIYSNPPELSPVVQVRLVKGTLLLGDVLHILPTTEGGLHVDHRNGACEVSKTGNIAYVYTAPATLRLSEDGLTRHDRFGRGYTQTSLEVGGTAEGVRVSIYGRVEAAPKPTNQKRGSPLQFFLLEYNPQKPDEPLRHEVWATNKPREDLQAMKLKKDDSIEAVLYRHTWEVELQDGKKATHTRHNLAKILTVERKGSAKRMKTGQEEEGEEKEAQRALYPFLCLLGSSYIYKML